jgi:hypothetical protein
MLHFILDKQAVFHHTLASESKFLSFGSRQVLKIHRRKRRDVFPIRFAIYFVIRLLTPLQAAGNALAIAGSKQETHTVLRFFSHPKLNSRDALNGIP